MQSEGSDNYFTKIALTYPATSKILSCLRTNYGYYIDIVVMACMDTSLKGLNMKKHILLAIVSVSIILLTTGCGPDKHLTITERQNSVINMENETLANLYAQNPSTKTIIANSAGYAVFSNANVNVVFVSGGGGYGTVVDNSTGLRTYMKMALGGVGLGLGIKDYRQVLIFKDKYTLRKFIDEGWEFGGQADAAAKTSDKGGAVGAEGSFKDGIMVYAMTENGLTLNATVAGTKYWKDDELNWEIK